MVLALPTAMVRTPCACCAPIRDPYLRSLPCRTTASSETFRRRCSKASSSRWSWIQARQSSACSGLRQMARVLPCSNQLHYVPLGGYGGSRTCGRSATPAGTLSYLEAGPAAAVPCSVSAHGRGVTDDGRSAALDGGRRASVHRAVLDRRPLSAWSTGWSAWTMVDRRSARYHRRTGGGPDGDG
jgi:hypothetical protein